MRITSIERSEIQSRLRAAMRRAGHSQQQVAECTGVHQSQVSRILKGDFFTRSRNVKKVCNYANSLLGDTAAGTPENEGLLVNAALDLWDGSDEGVQKLVNLFTAVKRLGIDKLKS